MNLLRLFPVYFSFILLAAHFLRAGYFALTAMTLLAPCLLLVRRPWVARLNQILLPLGAVEWLRTLVVFVRLRQEMGMPWLRLALILGIIALGTLASALVFCQQSLRQRYHLRR